MSEVGERSVYDGVGSLFSDYCDNPGNWWPETTHRQARKIVGRIERLSKQRGISPVLLADQFIAMATLRLRCRRPTIYLSNVGSSGSHWLESLMMVGGNMYGAGEVYLPVSIKKRLALMTLRDQAVFIDALHLLHARTTPRDFLYGNAVNSCHSQGIEHYTRSEPECVRILLVRDPLDICLSRTFRKGEYRHSIAPGATDEEYLDYNIDFIQKFFSWADSQRFSMIVRYEDLKADPRRVVREICDIAQAPVADSALEAAIQDHDEGRIREVGSARPSNLYRGEHQVIPQRLTDIAERKLSSVRGSYGYA